MSRRMDARTVGSPSLNERRQADDTPLQTNRPIRILHPVWRLASGGLERQLVEVVNGLPRERFRHVVLVRGWSGESEALAAQLNDAVEVIRETDLSGGALARRMAAIVRTAGIDVVHVRGLSTLPDAIMAANWVGDTPVMFSFHGFEDAEPVIGGIRRKVLRESALRAADRWAVSASAGAAIAERLNLPVSSFGVIANGVDLQRFQPSADHRESGEIRRHLGLPTDRILFVTCGSLKPVKGHDVLVDAIGRLDSSILRRCTWVMVGRDYLGGALQTKASRIQGADVRFVGEMADVAPWLQVADVFVLPSLWEGMSNALLQAMACGCAVIATRAGGNVNVIDSEATGLLVEPGDVGCLASVMERLATNANERAALGRSARARATAFSMESMLSAYAMRYAAAASAYRSDMTNTPSPRLKQPCPAGVTA
jgi:glycosyltransferase involved in cell wall biosynthesis